MMKSDHLKILQTARSSIAARFAPFIAIVCLLTAVACGPVSDPGPPIEGKPIGSNTLSAGDVISIAFPAAGELNQSQKIRLDGKISLPMIGEVTAAGKSPRRLQDELAGRYEDDLQDPKVIVALVSSSALVYVNGEVLGGGKVLLDRELTVYEAIMESGGFSQLANQKKVIVTRLEDGKLRTHVLNMKEQGREVFYVKPYDTITVGQLRF